MIPTGCIILWYGAIVDIPAGYVICDGNNGTPNLQDKFIVGAGNLYAVDETGGADMHEHQLVGDGHTHPIPAGGSIAAGADYSSTTASANVTATTSEESGLPPYHALAYIMKT